MPSKIQMDENLWFLYVCLQNSDFKSVSVSSRFLNGTSTETCLQQIDFHAVSDITNLKPPAARMRYIRLRRAIENGSLTGAHGSPIPAGSNHPRSRRRRRRPSPIEEVRADHQQQVKGGDDDFGVIQTRSGLNITRATDRNEKYTGNDSTEDDSGDDAPLIKRQTSVDSKPIVTEPLQPSDSQGPLPALATGHTLPVLAAGQALPALATEQVLPKVEPLTQMGEQQQSPPPEEPEIQILKVRACVR